MDFSTYIKESKKTAIYPKDIMVFKEDSSLSFPLIYPAMKITGEAEELFIAVNIKPMKVDDIIKEAGDVCWYLACFFRELDIPMTNLGIVPGYNVNSSISHAINIWSLASRVSETMGKIIRDGYNGKDIDAHFQRIKILIKEIWVTINHLCSGLGISIDIVLDKNIAKLTSRKDRGVLTGSGDNR